MASYQYVYVMRRLTQIFPGGKKVLEDITLAFLPGAKIGVLRCNLPEGDPTMTRLGVCITVLFLVGCTSGTDVIYGSSIRPGGGLPSIGAMAVGRVGAQPAPAASDTPASPAPSAVTSPDRRGIGIGQPGNG